MRCVMIVKPLSHQVRNVKLHISSISTLRNADIVKNIEDHFMLRTFEDFRNLNVNKF